MGGDTQHRKLNETFGKIEFTICFTRQITALILSKYIGLYALSRPRSNFNTIWPLNSICYCFCNCKQKWGQLFVFLCNNRRIVKQNVLPSDCNESNTVKLNFNFVILMVFYYLVRSDFLIRSFSLVSMISLMSWNQSHYIEVAQGSVSSRAIHNWLWIFSLFFATKKLKKIKKN